MNGYPIWANYHPMTPDRCLQPTKSDQDRKTLATGEQSIDVKGRLDDATLAPDILRLGVGFLLPGHADNLLLREPRILHICYRSIGRLYPILDNNPEITSGSLQLSDTVDRYAIRRFEAAYTGIFKRVHG